MPVACNLQIDILRAMETQRSYFRQMTAGALISGLSFILLATGCIPGSVSGDSPDGQTMTVKTALACSATPSGCLCASRNDQPGDLNACNGSSVAVHGGEQGVCCSGADLCACDAFACRNDATLGFCQCGSTASFEATFDGPAITACPSPAVGQKCCLSTDTRVCTCSGLDCEAGTTMVASCTVAMVSVCGTQQQSATSCK
jgi:hypothetical protein